MTSKYQSAEFAGIAVDELTKNTVNTFNILRGSLRWSGVDDTFFIGATNPGGIGHGWVKDYWIDRKFPPELRPLADQFAFVQALPDDNPHLTKSYWQELETLPPELAKAWRYGDWGVFAGQVFKEFTYERHTFDLQDLPEEGINYRGVDSGYTAPFCCLWGRREINTGRIWIYREVYQKEMTDRQQAQLIVDSTPPDEQITTTFADPAMWAKKNAGDLVTDATKEYAGIGVILTKADNDRINGVRKVHRLLANLPDGKPGLMIARNCTNLIKQIQNLVSDPRNPEDVDTKAEDHAFDTLRYLLTNIRDGSVSKAPKIVFNNPLAGTGL